MLFQPFKKAVPVEKLAGKKCEQLNSSTIRRCYKDVSIESFFPCSARLWYSRPLECFLLIYNLNGFKPRHLLTLGSV